MRALEQRLSDLESLLQRPENTPPSGVNVTPLSPRPEAHAVGAEPHSGEPAPPADEEQPAASLGAVALKTQVQNLEIIEEAHKRLPLFKMVTDNLAGDYDSPAVTESLRRVPGQHIPVRQAEAILVENTIREICDDLPIFDVPSFLEWVRRPETLKQRDVPSQWVCLNATIALTILTKTLNRSYSKIAKFAWAYLKNAYSAFPEMMIQGGDIWGVQAALVMATFMLRASSDTRAAAMFLSIAVRTMQTSGLQPSGGDAGSGTTSRVFWATYILDTEISLNCGIPPLLHDEDIDAPFPVEEDRSGLSKENLTSGSIGTAVFALRADLATIQARVRSQLYAAKAFRLSDDGLLQAVSQLASTLDTWRSNVPTDVQPGRHGQMSDAVLETPVIMLHLSYYNSVSMVHWAVHRHSKWSKGDATGIHREQMAASAIRVKTATKVVVQLLPRIKAKPLTDIW